jgi:hypothetical protein
MKIIIKIKSMTGDKSWQRFGSPLLSQSPHSGAGRMFNNIILVINRRQ